MRHASAPQNQRKTEKKNRQNKKKRRIPLAVFDVDDEEDDAEHQHDAADDDVADAQEGILASHPGNGAQNHALPSLKAAHGIVWVTVG